MTRLRSGAARCEITHSLEGRGRRLRGGDTEVRGTYGRVGKVATRLDGIRNDRHREALLVLQLCERGLVDVRPAHVLHDGDQATQKEESNAHRHHQLDQGEAALRGRGPDMKLTIGIHGSTYSVKVGFSAKLAPGAASS